ncbi:hypothetical protein UFOVP600_43 [uncultured Caudovirales phage]|uniref:Uncharacterized protein n=1 Tax=uncultured Caudovirales phage TaxID=2100421 RepID=A0A6J5MXF0_9CAUD|nr:hypothetical protein UFOVP600_43 [uncultured Caudovirales phage]
MEVQIEYQELKLRVEIEFTHPTFEEEYLNLNGNFEIETIKLEDSEIDIMDLLFDKIDYIKLLTSDQL